MSTKREIDSLVERLKQDPWGGESERISKELIEIGSPAVLPLLKALQNHDHPCDEIVVLVQTLGEIGDVRAMPFLQRLLDHTESESLHSMLWYWRISIALGKCGDKSVFPTLLDALCGASHEGVGGAYETLVAFGSDTVPGLLDVLTNPAPWVQRHLQLHYPEVGDNTEYIERHAWTLRRWVSWILGEIGDKRAVPVFLKLFEVSTDDLLGHNLRDAIVRSLGDIGDVSAIPYLVNELESPRAWSRIQAVRALNKIVSTERQLEIIDRQVVALTAVLKDSFANTRSIAAKVLSEIDDARVIPLLKAMLADTDLLPQYPDEKAERVCDRVADILEDIGTPEALTAVEEWKKQQA